MKEAVIRKTIGIDIDDVIAANAEGFIEWTNKQYGTSLSIDDYDDRWTQVWSVDHDEAEKRAIEYHASGHIATYKHIDNALEVLRDLKKDFRLIIITARRVSIDKLTRSWVESFYPNIFDEIIFAGFFDAATPESLHMTKAELAKHSKVDFLIDDQLKHCLAASEVGIKAVLFGNYAWNQSDELPDTVARCNDWQAVKEYFHQQALL